MGKRRDDKSGSATPADDQNGVFGGGDLTFYLVSRFIVVLVCVMAAETAVAWLEGVALVSGLETMLGDHVSDADGTASIFAVLQMLTMLLHDALAASSPPFADATTRSVVVLVAIAMLLSFIVPVFVGAMVFALMVMRKVRALQMRREEELARMERQRSQFITDVAHDLRTPLMAISGMAHALSDGLVSDEQMRAEYLHAVSDRADKMGELVSSVFDYTKLDGEGFVLQREDVNLPELLLREAAVAYGDAEDAGLELTVHVPENRCTVNADPVQLARIVANLLENAIKHNEAGCEVALVLVRQAGMARVVVADTGKPIAEDAEDLFQPFTRGDASRSTVGGSGLGLSICKRVADMHGFSLTLEQPYGRFPKAFVLRCPVEE
jgi:signal transduction histidine kinase